MGSRKKKPQDEEYPDMPEKPSLNIPAKFVSENYPDFVHTGKDCVIVEKEQLGWWIEFQGDTGKYMVLPEEVKVQK